MAALLLRSTLAMLVAFGGGALGVALGRVAPRRLRLLVLAALAGLLAVTLLDVLPDAKARLSWPAFGLALGSGFLLFWGLSRHVSSVCPACSVGDFGSEAPARLGQNLVLLMAALGIHCVMDGVAVVVGDEIAGHLNLALLLAVAFHKLPEGLALALLLLGAGYSRRAALLWTCGIESMTDLGAVLGLFGLRHFSPFLLGLIFAHVGGGFLYLAAATLGLTAHPRHSPTKSPVRPIL